MKKVELLSPAGNMECLNAAIKAGCDAVYLSGKMYGARAFAGNFSDDEIIKAINVAHSYGVKVYVTINTIVYEKEVDNFINYVRFLHKNNVDAVLVQDLGMMDLIRKKFPNLQIHASTQMHIHNYEGAKLASKLGIKRVVMARETPIDIVKKINNKLDIETEVFIHGALCISYSGQCLASTLIGPRSANRGTCAGICRKAYDLYDKGNNKLNKDRYLLSSKELCTIKDIKKIIEAGVSSLKIEGRMKRAEYVYLVVSLYKKAIDSYYKNNEVIISDEDIIKLKKMYNRDFTNGFMLGTLNNDFTYEKRPNHIGIKVGKVIDKVNNNLKIKLCDNLNVHDAIRILDDKEDKGIVINKMFINNKSVLSARKNDVISIKYSGYVSKGQDVLLTSDYELINSIDSDIKNKKRTIPIDAFISIKENENIVLTATDGVNIVRLNSDIKPDKSINSPLTIEKVEKQMLKTNDTVYEVNNLKVELDDNLFVAVSVLNELRRNLLDELDKKRISVSNFEEQDYYCDVPSFDLVNKTAILTNNPKKHSGYDIIYTPLKEKVNDKVIYKLPRIIYEYEKYNNKVLIGELGSMLKYDKFDTDFSFNVVNSYAVAFLHSMGAKLVTLSYELTYNQTKDIIDAYKKRYNKNPNLQVIFSSFPEAMICKYDINKKYKVGESYLQDEYNNRYKIVSRKDYTIIYNYQKKVLNNLKSYYDIGVNCLRENDKDC